MWKTKGFHRRGLKEACTILKSIYVVTTECNKKFLFDKLNGQMSQISCNIDIYFI